jgi:hypothetical protein
MQPRPDSPIQDAGLFMLFVTAEPTREIDSNL